jgi:hypothetical protein
MLINNGADNTTIEDNLTVLITVDGASNTILRNNQTGLPNENLSGYDLASKGMGVRWAPNTLIQNNTIRGRLALSESNQSMINGNRIKDSSILRIRNSEKVKVIDNQFGINNEELKGSRYKIYVGNSEQVELGGPNPGEGNTFALNAKEGPSNASRVTMWITDSHAITHSGNTYLPHPLKAPDKNDEIQDLGFGDSKVIDFGDLDGIQNAPRVTSTHRR